jgi:hypothetical protein
MRSLIIIILFSAFVWISCDSDKNKALRYNDQIVIYQVQLINGLEKLYDHIQAKQADSATLRYETLRKDVKVWLQDAQKVEPVAGGEIMKEKTVDLLTFYDELFEGDFSEYFKILNSGSPDTIELQTLYTKIQFMELMAVQLERELGEAQDSFVTRYGVRVKRPKDSEESDSVKTE